MKKLWKKIRTALREWIERNVVADDPADRQTAGPPSARPWRDCRLSSNWGGENASKRMMNLLSPKFPDAKAREYLDWQRARGCDHVHLLLVNQADGEGSGFSGIDTDAPSFNPYGVSAGTVTVRKVPEP